MDFFTSEQVWGIFMFIVGAGVLNWCNRWERKREEWRKDPKNKYKKDRRKLDFTLPTTWQGTMMTVSGSLLSFVGITLFFLHIV
jgi:hypothetical protein